MNNTITWSLDKYKQNLRIDGDFVYSYSTKVAEIDHLEEKVKPLGYWSMTTSKHINYVAREYGYKVSQEVA